MGYGSRGETLLMSPRFRAVVYCVVAFMLGTAAVAVLGEEWYLADGQGSSFRSPDLRERDREERELRSPVPFVEFALRARS